MSNPSKELADRWDVLCRQMRAAGFGKDVERISSQGAERWRQAKTSDWNPHYQWCVEEAEIVLGIRIPAMPDPDWSLEEIEAAQEAYERTRT